MRLQSATPEEECARIAASQHGVITYEQLLAVGLTQPAIQRRVRASRLHRVYRGVYAVGHTALSSEGRWLAAVLASGKGAVLSHRSAAEHWGLLEGLSSPIHVSVPGDAGKKKRPGLLIHRSSSLGSSAVEVRNHIAVTTPARTFADLRRTEPPSVVRRAAQVASFKGLEIGNEGDESGVRSELERRFLRFCHRNGLPQPAVNVRVGPLTVDFLWPKQRVVVETDGWEAHRGRAAFEDDHSRDLILRQLGYGVLRFTWRQLETDSASVLALLRGRLGIGVS
jgi:hypothetical protein